MPLCMQGRSANSAADQSMHFWGICCESGKQYAQVVGQRFRITMAVLDPKSPSESGDKTVSLIVIRGGVEYLLCVLKHEEIHQVNLNLIFDKGENVIFYINGYGKVYLSGYQLTESENDVLNDENGYLCPLVEVTSESMPQRKGKMSKTAQNSTSQSMTPKSKKKMEVDKSEGVVTPDKRKKGDTNRSIENSKIVDLDFDDESESDDEDYEAEEESESDDESSESDSLDEEEEEEDDEVEQEEDDDVEEQEEVVYSKKSQKKRKLENTSQPQKRSRLDSMNKSPSGGKSENDVSLDDNDSKDSSEDMNSSIGHTPMPKRQTPKEKKRAKQKRLSEISNLSGKPVKGQKSPVAESTPNKASEYSAKKLEGGVEIQDVVIGRGPEARIGKMVHVFYIGRFPNKQIFDSRVPGKKPFSFKLGTQQVIKGWDVGIQGMRVGGKRKLKVPPSMAYGSSSVEGIPANSTLHFVVELQAVS